MKKAGNLECSKFPAVYDSNFVRFIRNITVRIGISYCLFIFRSFSK